MQTEEVEACLEAFPVLVRQIRETVGMVEEAVVQVCSNFGNIVSRARGSVASTEQVLHQAQKGASTGHQDTDLIGSARGTIETLLGQMDQAAQASAREREQTQARVARSIETIDKKLKDIDRVSSALHILALNAKIEASRAGTHGVGFGVVASNTTLLAKEAQQSTAAIRDLFQDLRGAVGEQKAAQVGGANEENQTHARIAQCRDSASHLLDLLGQSQADLRQAMAAQAHEGEELATDISGAIVALQFQDAVSQRLGHVCSALENMAAHLHGEADSQQMPGDWVGQLQEHYTMLVERQAQAQATGAAPTKDDDLGANIELF